MCSIYFMIHKLFLTKSAILVHCYSDRSKKWRSESHSVMSNSLWPMDCSPPGSSVHGFLQARILEWVAISFSRGSSQPTDLTQVSCIVDRLYTDRATREAQVWERRQELGSHPPHWSSSLKTRVGLILRFPHGWSQSHREGQWWL